jgi:hypothetical protein
VTASTSRTTSFRKRLARRMPLTVDAARFVHNPRWELAVWRDYRRTRRDARSLRAVETDAAESPALVLLYRDNVFESKAAMIPGTALRLDGMPVVVAVPDSRATRSARLVRAMGADRVVDREALDDDLPARAAAERSAAVDEVIALVPDLAAVKAWSFDGHQAGMHIVASLIRLTFEGDPDLAEHAGLLHLLADDTVLQYQRGSLLLDRIRPAIMLVQEANYAFNGPVVDLATSRGIDVIQTITTWRDDALMSKRITSTTRRVDAKSVAPATLERLERDDPWTDRHDDELDRDFADRYGGRWKLGGQFQPDTRAFTAEEIRGEIGLDDGKTTVVVFAHVLWDASLFFGVDLFDNYGHWLTETVRAATENDRVNWVIKAHPANVFRQSHGDTGGEAAEMVLLRRIAPDPPDHVKVLHPDTPISTMSLYEFADAAVTVRGTPGLEMACFGKPVFTAGTGSYSGLGFTIDSASRDEYLERLAKLPDGLDTSADDARGRARRYAHTLFLRRPWIPHGFQLVIDFPERGWHPLDQNVRRRALSRHGARPDFSPDWTTWARRSGGADHLA